MRDSRSLHSNLDKQPGRERHSGDTGLECPEVDAAACQYPLHPVPLHNASDLIGRHASSLHAMRQALFLRFSNLPFSKSCPYSKLPTASQTACLNYTHGLICCGMRGTASFILTAPVFPFPRGIEATVLPYSRQQGIPVAAMIWWGIDAKELGWVSASSGWRRRCARHIGLSNHAAGSWMASQSISKHSKAFRR
jgi:hypothetical protein